MPQEEIKSNEKQEEIKTPEETAETPLTVESLQTQILALQAKLEEMKKTSQNTEQVETARIDKATERLGIGNPAETVAVKAEVKGIEAEKQTVLATAETKIGEEKKTAEFSTEKVGDKSETEKSKINIKELAEESLNDSGLKRSFYDNDINKMPTDIQDTYKDRYTSKLISLKHKIASGDLSLEDAKYEAEEATRETVLPLIKDRKIRENNFDLPGATDRNKDSFYFYMNKSEPEIKKQLTSSGIDIDLKFLKGEVRELEETKKNVISRSKDQLNAGGIDFKKSNAATAELDRQIDIINKLISSESAEETSSRREPKLTKEVETTKDIKKEITEKVADESDRDITNNNPAGKPEVAHDEKVPEEEARKPREQSSSSPFTAKELEEFDVPDDAKKTESMPDNKTSEEYEEQRKHIENLMEAQKDYFDNLMKELSSYSSEFSEKTFDNLYKEVAKTSDNEVSDQNAINNIVSKIELFIEKTKNAKSEYAKIFDALDKKDAELKKENSSDTLSWRNEIDKKRWEISEKAPNFDQKLYSLEQALNTFKK